MAAPAGSAGSPSSPPETAATDARAGDGDKANTLTDEQIAAITEGANSAEIEQAKLAESKAKDARVSAFAAMMIRHHTDAKNKQAKLGLKATSSPESMKMEKDAQDTLSTLKSKTGGDFDSAYIDAQVDEHQQVAKTIEQQLMPSAKSAALKAYLADIKPTVDAHLQRAREIQSKLKPSAVMK